jgi:hypothetical protein
LNHDRNYISNPTFLILNVIGIDKSKNKRKVEGCVPNTNKRNRTVALIDHVISFFQRTYPILAELIYVDAFGIAINNGEMDFFTLNRTACPGNSNTRFVILRFASTAGPYPTFTAPHLIAQAKTILGMGISIPIAPRPPSRNVLCVSWNTTVDQMYWLEITNPGDHYLYDREITTLKVCKYLTDIQHRQIQSGMQPVVGYMFMGPLLLPVQLCVDTFHANVACPFKNTDFLLLVYGFSHDCAERPLNCLVDILKIARKKAIAFKGLTDLNETVFTCYNDVFMIDDAGDATDGEGCDDVAAAADEEAGVTAADASASIAGTAGVASATGAGAAVATAAATTSNTTTTIVADDVADATAAHVDLWYPYHSEYLLNHFQDYELFTGEVLEEDTGKLQRMEEEAGAVPRLEEWGSFH